MGQCCSGTRAVLHYRCCCGGDPESDVWFGVQVLFTELRPVPIICCRETGTVALPVLERFDPLAGAMMVTALLAITVFRIGMIKVLLCSAAFGLVAGTAGLI